MNSGLTVTNDGSHFALLDALLYNDSPALENPRQFAFGDSAYFEGRYYSDRNPGLAFITWTTTKVLTPVQAWFAPLLLDPRMGPRYNEVQVSLIRGVMLVPAFAASALFAAMIALSRTLGASYPNALAAAVMVLTGTLLFRYATLFYSHIVAAALVTWSVVLVLRYAAGGPARMLWGGAFLFSLAVVVEHLVALVLIPLGACLLASSAQRIFTARTLFPTILAGLFPLGLLATYNTVCFNSPFSLAHFHHSEDVANHSLSTLFNFQRVGEVLGNFMLGAPRAEVGKQDLTGLLTTSPFLLACLLPVFSGSFRSRGSSAAALTLAGAILLVIIGAAGVFAPYGGWDRDYRYFVAILPLCAPFLALALADLLAMPHSWPARTGQGLGFALLFAGWVYAVIFQLGHVRHSLQPQYPTHWVNLQAAAINVSLAWLYFTLIACLLWLVWKGLARTQLAARPAG